MSSNNAEEWYKQVYVKPYGFDIFVLVNLLFMYSQDIKLRDKRTKAFNKKKRRYVFPEFSYKSIFFYNIDWYFNRLFFNKSITVTFIYK